MYERLSEAEERGKNPVFKARILIGIQKLISGIKWIWDAEVWPSVSLNGKQRHMACQVSSNDSSCVFSLAEEKGLLFALSDNQLFCVGHIIAEGMHSASLWTLRA